MCRGGTLQSAIPALPVRFGTLRQWCVNSLARIFYPFWSPRNRKLRIGLFDRRATKWCFWPSCDQNLGLVILMRDWVKFSKFRPWETLDLYANDPESFPLGIFIPFWRPMARNYESVFFDRCATEWCFWPACDQNLCSVFLTVVRPGKPSKMRDKWRPFDPSWKWSSARLFGLSTQVAL